MYFAIQSRVRGPETHNLSQPSGVQKTENNVPGQEKGGVARYKLDGNVDDSWGTNNGTNNGATFQEGVYGQAGEFQSSNSDYIDIPNIPSSSEISFGAWFNSDDVSNTGGIITLKQNWNHRLRTASGKVVFAVRDPSKSNTVTISKSVESGKWYHVFGTYDENGNMKLYLNGSLVDHNKYSFDAIGRSDQIGNSDTNARFYSGKIDDVRIYNTALTPTQIEKIFHKGSYRIPRGDKLQ